MRRSRTRVPFAMLLPLALALALGGSADIARKPGIRAPGDVLWTDFYNHATFGGSAGAIAWHRGRVVAGGVVGDGTNFFIDAYVRTVRDSNGALEWQETVDLGNDGMFDNIRSIAAARGRAFAAGNATKVAGDSDFLVRAYNPRTGAQLWQDQFDPNGSRDEAFAITARRN